MENESSGKAHIRESGVESQRPGQQLHARSGHCAQDVGYGFSSWNAGSLGHGRMSLPMRRAVQPEQAACKRLVRCSRPGKRAGGGWGRGEPANNVVPAQWSWHGVWLTNGTCNRWPVCNSPPVPQAERCLRQGRPSNKGFHKTLCGPGAGSTQAASGVQGRATAQFLAGAIKATPSQKPPGATIH